MAWRQRSREFTIDEDGDHENHMASPSHGGDKTKVCQQCNKTFTESGPETVQYNKLVSEKLIQFYNANMAHLSTLP